MAAMFIGNRGRRIQFWKRTAQGPFQQNSFPTGQIVSEKKKIHLNDFLPYFLFLAMKAILFAVRGRQI